MQLFYRDPIECIESLLNSPLSANDIDFTPYKLYKSVEKSIRVYSEWLSGDAAWTMQVCDFSVKLSDVVFIKRFQQKIPSEATLIGTILSSDKTRITAMTGDRIAHPLLISLANMNASYRAKSSHHAFLLLALLPVPKFITSDKPLRGVLESRLIHECLDFILNPLKKAACYGVMMSDPYGSLRYCFTPLAAYIVDTPEAAMLAGVGGKTSHVTMAGHKQFGDPFKHESRTASTTLAQLHAVATKADPDGDLKAYLKEAKKFRLNGVDKPFWRDWPLAEPCLFLTPEPLHHFNKEFYDHDLKWCIRKLGEAKIDFRFSILQPRIGFRHFKDGVSQLKQVTGREHRNIQRHIVAIIAGAASQDFVIAIRSMMDFRYLAQAPEVDDIMCDKIDAALLEFHNHKSAIMNAKVRVGKGNRPIENWYIPKLELMQSVVTNIKANGAAINFTADHTEHAHIEVVKDPARSGNNQKYEEQICRHLDRSDKCRQFDLATAIRDAQIEFSTSPESPLPSLDNELDNSTDDEDNIFSEDINGLNQMGPSANLLDSIRTVSNIGKTRRVPTNYFKEAACLVRDHNSNTPLPFRTFMAGSRTAIHLSREPYLRRKLIHEVASTFHIPDLAPSLTHFFVSVTAGDSSQYTVGGRRIPAAGDTFLPFQKLEVWQGLRIQSKDYHDPRIVHPPQTLCASPPEVTGKWPLGRFDNVLINIDPDKEWPQSKMTGSDSES